MPRTAADRARSATPVTQTPSHAQSSVCLFDGGALNVDMAGYLAQHDVVYLRPPQAGSEGMPIGDGDLGAAVWCPGHLQFLLNKSDLWSDPPEGGPLDGWRQPSAGTIAIRAEPGFLAAPDRFEQRLSLHSGVVTIQSDTASGACQVTTFLSATAGVLVVRYRDQGVRAVARRVDVSLQREAHLFAIGETAGILQAFRDRRYALLARVANGAKARAEGTRLSSLHLEPARSVDFTLYVAVATSPSNGDPVAMARSRIEAAMERGFDRLLAEQRQHWAQFWEKSFVRLTGAPGDSLPPYLESLWYLSLYQQACCSRGFDAPLANGSLWPGSEEGRGSPAIYSGRGLRAMLANLTASNHLELSVPYVDTYFRMLPELAARTGRDSGHGGARFPTRFNRYGVEPGGSAAELAQGSESGGPAGAASTQSGGATAAGTGATASVEAGAHATREAVCEGLKTGLLVYDAWRHAPDPFFLRERAYPLLRAAAVYAVDRCEAEPRLWSDAEVRARLGIALRALLWAEREHVLRDELRAEWERALARPKLAGPAVDLHPFHALGSQDTADWFQRQLDRATQTPAGFFTNPEGVPDLAASAVLSGALSAVLLAERPDPAPAGPRGAAAFGGMAQATIRVFEGLPATWGGAFSLVAPGGFRMSAEAAAGRACYVGVKSLLGGRCRVVNPWGAGAKARVVCVRPETGAGGSGRDGVDTDVMETAAPIIEFETAPNTTYLIERQDMSLSRATLVRLIGKPNKAPKEHGALRIGLAPMSEQPAR
ncbi:MAG TPA: DUF5703 domain-containing protein [Chthonomonadaceae bacterium]|nr:DUF5703 domain-containing protein [Chthonomonadaceae bacterium]